MDPLSFLFGAFRIFGFGKNVYSLSKTISENSKEKREQRELNKRLNEITKRSDFEAAVMYLIAGGASWLLFAIGSLLGCIVISLFFLVHCGEIKKYSQYINVRRELILTAILSVVLAPLSFGITLLSALWLLFTCKRA